jgi:hypothetical protein
MTGVVLRPIRLPTSAQPELMLAWRRDNENPCLPTVRNAAFGHARSSVATP